MANKQTRQLREMSRKKDIHTTSFFTRTTYGAVSGSAGKKHVVEVLEHNQTGWAFNPERHKLKNKQRNRPHPNGLRRAQPVTSLIG